MTPAGTFGKYCGKCSASVAISQPPRSSTRVCSNFLAIKRHNSFQTRDVSKESHVYRISIDSTLFLESIVHYYSYVLLYTGRQESHAVQLILINYRNIAVLIRPIAVLRPRPYLLRAPCGHLHPVPVRQRFRNKRSLTRAKFAKYGRIRRHFDSSAFPSSM